MKDIVHGWFIIFFLSNISVPKKIDNFDKKITNTSGLIKKTEYNAEIADIENRIRSVTRLITTAPVNAKAT